MPRIAGKRKSTTVSVLPSNTNTKDTFQFVFKRKLINESNKSTNDRQEERNALKDSEPSNHLSISTFAVYPPFRTQLTPGFNTRKARSLLPTRRRSSMALRGKKLIFQDAISVPHDSISHSEYCRHISPDLSGPLRMKQLVLWGLDILSKQYDSNDQFSDILTQIIQETTQALIQNQISLSWYQKHDSSTTFTSLLPNPRNIELEALLEHYKKFTLEATREIAEWERLLTQSQLDFPNDINECNLSKKDNDSLQLYEQFRRDNHRKLEQDIQWMNTFSQKIHQLHNVCLLFNRHGQYVKRFTDSLLHRVNTICFSSSTADPLSVLRAISRSTT